MGVAPLEGLTQLPQVTAAAGGRRVALTGLRGGAVTMLETMRLALDALRTHKLGSFLTLLGVILAVATLVAVMSIVSGMNFYVADRIANLGANVFIVDRFGIITSQDAWVKAQKRPLITMEDYERMRHSMKTAKAVAALDDHNIEVRSGNTRLQNTDVMGVSANYAEVRNINIAQGRFINETDDDHRGEVVLIGADVADRLFSNVDPIGKLVRAETHEYQVIGVAERIGSAFGQSQDNFMIMPLHTFEKELHRPRDWVAIFVQAGSAEMMSACEDEARMLMRAWRHLPYEGIPGGGRHRHHEHHVGERYGADTRDRDSAFAGRAQETYFAAVHDGIRCARGDGRNYWRLAGLRRGCAGGGDHIHSRENAAKRRHHFAVRLHRSGSFLWNLSGDAGGETGSDRSVASGDLKAGYREKQNGAGLRREP